MSRKCSVRWVGAIGTNRATRSMGHHLTVAHPLRSTLTPGLWAHRLAFCHHFGILGVALGCAGFRYCSSEIMRTGGRHFMVMLGVCRHRFGVVDQCVCQAHLVLVLHGRHRPRDCGIRGLKVCRALKCPGGEIEGETDAHDECWSNGFAHILLHSLGLDCRYNSIMKASVIIVDDKIARNRKNSPQN